MRVMDYQKLWLVRRSSKEKEAHERGERNRFGSPVFKDECMPLSLFSIHSAFDPLLLDCTFNQVVECSRQPQQATHNL